MIRPRVMGDAEIGEDEACRQFRCNFFDAARLVRKACAEVASEPMFGAGCMGTFMNFGADEARGVLERLERWHEDVVEIDAVMGVEGAIGDRDFQRRDEGVDGRVALGRRDGCRHGRRVAIHLRAIEH